MRHLTFPALAVLALALSACGAISNEELQMLALLPDDSLAISTPEDKGQALTSEEYASSEQALGDRVFVLGSAAKVAAGMNAFTTATLEHLRDVAQRRPTSRDGSKRIWGPVALKNGKGYVRVTLEPDPAARCAGESGADDQKLRVRFSIELSGKKDKDFKGMVTGTAHGDYFDESCGTMHFDRKIYKAFGGTGGLADPDGVDLAWERNGTQQAITATVDGAKSGELENGRTYRYVHTLGSGDGEFHFALRNDKGALVEAALQWADHGQRGRSDFRVDRALTGLLTGTACWKPGAGYYADSDRAPSGDISACGTFEALPLP